MMYLNTSSDPDPNASGPDIDSIWHHDDVNTAVIHVEQELRAGRWGFCALVFECMPHVVRRFNGADDHIEDRWRLAAQMWRRTDGTIDSRTYQQSESPWGGLAR